MTQHQCSAALALAKCAPQCTVLLCKTGSQQAVCHCNYTCGGLLFIQLCSGPTALLCCTGFGKINSPLYSLLLCKTVSQQALCQCNYTCGDLLFIQLCSDPTPMLFSTALGKTHFSLLSAALQNRLTAGLYQCHFTYEGLLFVSAN